MIVETDRLVLREIKESDFDHLFRMNSDPLIMKYVGDGSIRSHQQMVDELQLLISHYHRKPGCRFGTDQIQESFISRIGGRIQLAGDQPALYVGVPGYQNLRHRVHWSC